MNILDFDTFKSLVHQCRIDAENANSADAELTIRDYKEIFAEIASIFGSHRNNALNNLDELLSELSIRSVAHEEPLEFVFETIRILIDSLKGSTDNQPGYDNPWKHAIDLIMSNQHIFIAFVAPERICPSRFLALGHHVKTLRGMGYKIDIVNGRPNVSDEEMARINAETARLCKELGSPTLVYNVLRIVSELYDPVQQRYQLTRNLSTKPSQNVSSPPWGLLLQLAVKQDSAKSEPASPAQLFNELIQLVTATIGLSGVEPSSIFDMLVQSDETLIDFLQRAVIYDSLYTFNQIRPSDAVRMGTILFDDWIEANNESKIRNAMNIWLQIANVSMPKMPFAFQPDSLCRITGLSEDLISDCCENFLAHDPGGANMHLELPLKPESIDFGKRPFISIATSGFCMVEKSICSPNFLEAIFMQILSSKGKFNTGKAVEYLLTTVLAESGVKSKSGKYVVKKSSWDRAQEAECDAVVETDEEVLFLEVKAKSLTRASQTGDTHSLIEDLAKSLIESHTQALKHELRLRTHGSIEFKNGESISLSGRKIERVVVAISDFGCLHDRSIFEKFLSLCCRGDLASRTQPDRFEKVNEQLAEMRMALSELNKIGGLNQRKPFWNSWFLSIPQILLMLDSVKCEANFAKELVRLRAVQHGTFDFYREYQAARSWQEKH